MNEEASKKENEIYPTSGTVMSDFEYRSHLHLTRSSEAVETRRGEDAKYVLSKKYVASVKIVSTDGPFWHKIEVPQGYMSDLTSVPRPARSIVSRVGPHLEAAILHDWLYDACDVYGWKPKPYMKEFADSVMKIAMKHARVRKWRISVTYRAVHWWGGRKFKRKSRFRVLERKLIAGTDEYEACCPDIKT